MHAPEIINYLVPPITHLGFLGYIIAGIATLLETVLIVGLFFPGSTMVLIFGALSAAGYYNFWYLMFSTVLCAIIGDFINYKLGKKYGQTLFIKEKWFLKKQHLKKGKKLFDTHGAKSLFFCRLIPGLKETFPFIAGSMDTKLNKFLFWDFFGAIAWGFEFLASGYLFGSSINRAKEWIGYVTIVLVIVFLAFALLLAIKVFFINYGYELFQFQKTVWQFIITNPDIEKIKLKHQKIFSFLKSRLTTERFSGLALTILSILFLYMICVFIVIYTEISTKGKLFKFDLMFAHLVAYFRSMDITRIMLFITMFGNKNVILLSITTIILFILYKKQHYIIPFLSSTLGSTFTTWFIKHLTKRPRPLEAYYHAPGFSFPSGHATISVAFYGFIAYVLIRETKNLKLKFNIFIVILLIILLIGASRIYLDVHYFSDVLAGYIIGGLWLDIAIGVHMYHNFKQTKLNIQISKTSRYISYALISISLILCAIIATNFNPKPNLHKPQHSIPIRSILRIFKNEYLKYTTTIIGAPQKPINLIAQNNKKLINILPPLVNTTFSNFLFPPFINK